MERRIVAVMPSLEPELRKQMRETAAALGFSVEFYETSADALVAMETAEILFGNVPELCAKAPRLKWASTSFAGVEPFLKPGTFAAEGAILTNASGAYGVTIAEHIVMVALEMMRREAEYREIVRAHDWKRDLGIRSLYGSRITMLGTGDIGRKTAVRLRGFMPACITGISRSGRPVPEMDRTYRVDELERILPETDLLVMSLPGTPETTGIMNEARLRKLPADAYLINVGRGSAIDQKALEAILREGRLAGAALDVFETEPLPPEDSLWTCPRVHITTHTAGNSTLSHTRRFIVEMFLENLRRYAAHEPLNEVVNRELGY